MSTRIEKDSFGEMDVPVDAIYGVHSLRSRENFHAAGERLPLEINYGMAKLKHACATANMKLDLLDTEKGAAIQRACEQVLAGEADDAFLVDVFQAGSGTSSNMNTNEVIGNLACIQLGGTPGQRELVHPNDHVNKGQSTNNVFPSAIKVASVELAGDLENSARHLIAALRHKQTEFADVIKSGRTHLQDAVPVTMGQAFGAFARALEKDLARIEAARERCRELGVGGNAVGTGINTKAAFRGEIIAALNATTGENYRVAEDGIETTQFLTDLGDLSAAVRLLAVDVHKIANDLRLLSCGPKTGLAELVLPPVEPGSSIMPGKINPSICEATNMACIQVMGNDQAISIACSSGQLELNTHMPLIGTNLIKSIQIMTRACRILADTCIDGIAVNVERCRTYFEESAGLATVLNPILGYDKVSELVKESLKTGKNLRQLALEKNILSEADLETLLKKSTGPTL